MTDEFRAYRGLDLQYVHHYVVHSANQYITGDIHTNSIENFWSHLKRTLVGTYHSVSKKHLNSYVQEVSLRYNGRKNSVQELFNVLLTNSNRTLSYKQLINA